MRKSLQSIIRPLTLKHIKTSIVICCALLVNPSYAHFVEMIPDRDFLNSDNQHPLSINLRFTHPMAQGPVMDMQRPNKLSVTYADHTTDLLDNLQKIDDTLATQWTLSYQVTEPADLIFFVEPQPYWESAEGKMIIHYTKVVVDGYADFNGWDKLINAPVEIEPLTRPYSLWVGNSFQGIVRKEGKAVPFATIEVEWRNDGSISAPSAGYKTQIIKADINGTFSYVMPKAGWWGFAALLDADYLLNSPSGQQVPVELGGLIWVNAKKMQ